MKYQKYKLPEQYSKYVECIFSWEGFRENEIVIESPPSSYTSIVFNFGNSYDISNCKHTRLRVPQNFISGQAIRNYKLHLKGKICMLGIVFKPTGLFNYLNIPMYELTEERLDLSLIIPESVDYFLEMRNQSNIEKVETLKRFLIYLDSNGSYSSNDITMAANRILDSKGNTGLKNILDKVHMSRRQFERRFLEQVGISPKAYSKLRRFGYTCSLLAGKRKVKLTDVLYEGGYYDQSHFIRDFKYYAGRTPKFYVENNQELAHLIK